MRDPSNGSAILLGMADLREDIKAARAKVAWLDGLLDHAKTGEQRALVAENFKARRQLLGLVVRDALGDSREAQEHAVRLVAGVRSARITLTQIDTITASLVPRNAEIASMRGRRRDPIGRGAA